MEKQALKIPRSVLLMHRFASKDTSRKILRRIHVERDGDTLHAAATDGFRLLHVCWQADGALSDGETIAICADAAKAASKNYRAAYVYNNNNLVDARGGRIPSVVEEGIYPKWREVFGEIGIKAEEYAFDGLLLADFSTYLKETRKGGKEKGCCIKVVASGALSPLRYVPTVVPIDVESVEFVLMPVRY